jgi:hypothetical protein
MRDPQCEMRHAGAEYEMPHAISIALPTGFQRAETSSVDDSYFRIPRPRSS